MVDVSIIIVSYNTKKLILECIDSIREHTKGITCEIIVIDNNSSDGSAESLSKLSDVTLINNKENKGFGAANNVAMKIAKGRYLLLLNPDTLLLENSIQKMIDWMDQHPKAGVSSCTLVNPPNNSLQSNGGNFPDLWHVFLWVTFLDDIPGVTNLFGSYHYTPSIPFMNVFYTNEHMQDWVDGAFFLIRKEAYEKVGGFDENIFMYTEEVEYSYRFKKVGWELWFVPITSIIHLVGSSNENKDVIQFAGASIGKENAILSEMKNLAYFYEKHYAKWQLGILSYMFKLGALLRIVLFGVIGGQKEARKVYWKAFNAA